MVGMPWASISAGDKLFFLYLLVAIGPFSIRRNYVKKRSKVRVRYRRSVPENTHFYLTHTFT